MDNYFEKVRDYLLELNYTISFENKEEGVFVINNEAEGISNMVVGCAEPILVLEQHLFNAGNNAEVYKKLLQKNRDIVHGAFVLDDDNKVLFRDTLQLENLDLNELEGSLNSLGLLLSEYGDEIIRFSKN